jgi:leader peptidase (prepilin peptidase)/N-methyltransferase
LLNVAAISAGALDRVEGVWGGAASAFLVCLLLHRVRPAGFGGGDVTLSALAGAHLGWFGADVVIVGLVAGFACGGAVAAGALLAGLRHAEVAFGPPLLLGTWWALLRAIT